MPPSLSSQNWQVYGRKWPLPDISSKGKEKVPQLVSWDKNILCLREDYCGNSRIIPIPKGKQRSSLAARGLCGKIIHSEMTEEDVLWEIRSTFPVAMGNDNNFPFRFLQIAGGGSKSLIVPLCRWALGVTLWEIGSYGALPLSEMKNKQVIEAAITTPNCLLTRPPNDPIASTHVATYVTGTHLCFTCASGMWYWNVVTQFSITGWILLSWLTCWTIFSLQLKRRADCWIHIAATKTVIRYTSHFFVYCWLLYTV